MRACVRGCVCVCMCVCICMCVYVCVCVCGSVGLFAVLWFEPLVLVAAVFRLRWLLNFLCVQPAELCFPVRGSRFTNIFVIIIISHSACDSVL